MKGSMSLHVVSEIKIVGIMIFVMTLSCLVSGLPTRDPDFKRQLTDANSTYDYVIIGCGAAGLTVAARLSELRERSVICIEAGSLDNYEPEILIPYYIGLQPPGFYDWQIHTVPQTQLDGQTRYIPMGKGIGGGTLINGMVWNRGSQEGFNSWANLGNIGWAWMDLLPYFARSETFTPKTYPDQHFPSANFGKVHGSDGPVQVSYPEYFWTQSNAWFQALQSIGIPTAADPNEGLLAGGYFLPLGINPQNQTRSDARRTYYNSAANRSNLRVLPDSRVTRISFSGTEKLHATSVEYVRGSNLSTTIRARREVILAAGAIHSPQLLELSGIGQRSILQQHSIRVLQDLPGVGNNLQDHPMVHLNYPYTNRSLVTVNDFATNHTFNTQCENQYYTNKTGPWTAKASQAVAFPSLQQVTSHASSMLDIPFDNNETYLPSNYDATLRAGYTRQLQSLIVELRKNHTPAFEVLNNNAGGLDVALMRPLSRGTCHITSSNPFDPPAVDPRWLAHPLDYSIMITAMKFNQKLLNTPALSALQPSYVDVPRNASTELLERILRTRVGTEYHYSGTAAMLPRELGGVVDSNLLVYGTDNLRVVDTSIFPMVPGAHLQAVAYAVAEHASDIIKGVKSHGPT